MDYPKSSCRAGPTGCSRSSCRAGSTDALWSMAHGPHGVSKAEVALWFRLYEHYGSGGVKS